MKAVAKGLISLCLLAGLSACGGGGGGASTATSGTCATASNCALPSSVAGVPPQ
jgi:hypothetical protein